jgi:predicted transcriptional regulator
MPKKYKRTEIEILLDILKSIVANPNSCATRLSLKSNYNYNYLLPVLLKLNDKGFVSLKFTVTKSEKSRRIIVQGLTPKGIAFMKDLEFIVNELRR